MASSSPSRKSSGMRLGPASPRMTIAILALLARLLPWTLLHLLSYLHLPHFDSSAQLLDPSSPAPATFRWDAVHFAAIARRGYEYEQQIAFQPGWPALIRCFAGALRYAGLGGGSGDVRTVIRSGEVLACGSYIGASVMLYDLTALLFSTPFAYSTCLLYLLAPAPAVLSSAYSEPLFALLTFSGFYLALKQRFLLASVLLAGATSVRATGALAVGVLVWLMVCKDEPLGVMLGRPTLLFRRAITAALPAAIIVSPFVASQVYFYHALCNNSNAPADQAWCVRRIPLAYSYVQEKYWNIGVLNYWTPAQIPNILLAAPVLSVIFIGSYRFFRSYLFGSPVHVHQTAAATATPPYHNSDRPSRYTGGSNANDPPTSPTTRKFSSRQHPFPPMTRDTHTHLPFYIHSTALALLLLFSAHTQIALRVCVTDPVTWWSLAGLAFTWDGADSGASGSSGSSEPRGPGSKEGEGVAYAGSGSAVVRDKRTIRGGMTLLGRLWVWWVVIYGSISIVLWAGHYPPA